MSQKKAIRTGDTTTHGGTVLEGIAGYEVMGKEMSCQGHMVSCPKCKGTYPIIDGVSSMPIHGRYPAVEGMRTGCGALLIASQDPFTFEWTGNPATIMGDGVFAFADKEPAETENDAFDEQLLLKNEDGLTFNDFRYEITLENGLKISGSTNQQGLTERIVTEEPLGITEIEIYSEDPGAECCSTFAAQTLRANDSGTSTTAGYKYYFDNIKTNSTGLGSSLKTVTLRGNARSLTSGEIALAKTVFKDSLDYTKIKVHKGNYIIGQDQRTAMTPNGEMYFPGKTFEEDFSKGSRHFFIHEMVHVWQYQLGYKVRINGIIIATRGGYGNGAPAYKYAQYVNSRSDLSEFNMEQQGDIIADYFISKTTASDVAVMAIMKRFIKDPSDVLLLPKTTSF